MFAKYISKDYIVPAPDSLFLKDKRAISNFPLFLENNPEIAYQNDFYPVEYGLREISDDNEGIWHYSLDNKVIKAEWIKGEPENV